MAEKEEYASKGVAGSGLGLGIAGTALALLNNGGDGLAGLLGGGNKMSVLQAENAQLKAQGYTDAATRGLAIEQARQAEQIACIQARFGTERQITDAAIANAVLETSVATTKLAGALECLQNTVAGISSTYVPAGKVTPVPQPAAFPPVMLPPGYPFFPYPPPPPATIQGTGGNSGTTVTQTGG